MKIVVGFSGGVDSAVTTRLLQKAGHEVHGLYMDNTDEKALWEAQVSAERMGIELTVIDVKSELEEKVCRPFTESYLRGETPNPCILCNPSVKFRQLIALADRIGAEKVATGHYARAENGALVYTTYGFVWDAEYDPDGLAYMRELCEERFYNGPEWGAEFFQLYGFPEWAVPCYEIDGVYFSTGKGWQ